MGIVVKNKAIQPLRKQMVRRLPSQDELLHRTPIVLTDRDKKILNAVHSFGVLTTDLIELAYFPSPSGGRQAPSSCAYDRLRVLWLWSYLDRIELPVSRTLGGRRPFLYTLGRRGVFIVGTQLGRPQTTVQRRRLDRLDDVFVEHDLIVATLWANLMALVRSNRLVALGWEPERALRALHMRVIDPQTGRYLPFLPDSLVEIHYPDGTVQDYFLEVDMGTLTVARFRRKLRAFELYLAQGLFAKTFDREEETFDVLVLTHSLPRLKNLWRAARLEVQQDRWHSYLFATFDILQPQQFAGEVWLTLGNGRTGLLGDNGLQGKTDGESVGKTTTGGEVANSD